MGHSPRAGCFGKAERTDGRLLARQTPITIMTITARWAVTGISPRTGIAGSEATGGRSAIMAVAADKPSRATVRLNTTGPSRSKSVRETSRPSHRAAGGQGNGSYPSGCFESEARSKRLDLGLVEGRASRRSRARRLLLEVLKLLFQPHDAIPFWLTYRERPREP